MKKYLVTGGCGFIGSHLVNQLISLKNEVIVIDDLSTGKKENISQLPSKNLIIADINDALKTGKSLNQVDGCFHLAAIASVEQSKNNWLATHLVNQTGFVNLLEAIRKSSRKIPVVFASSAAVYGNINNQNAVNESCLLRPATAYGADKLGCELHAFVAYQIHQIPYVGLRFFNVYGPRQSASSPYSGVISLFTQQMLNDENYFIYGNGKETRDFVFVDDVVQALTLAMNGLENDSSTFSGKILNVGTGKPTSIFELANTMLHLTQSNSQCIFRSERRGSIRHSLADIQAIKKAFGYKPSCNLIEGLQRTITYQKKRKTNAAY